MPQLSGSPHEEKALALRSQVVLSTVAALMVVTPDASSAASSAAASQASGDRWTHVSLWSTVQDDRIREASGISRSTYARPVVFLHNDSGDKPRFFAVGRDGATKAVFRVRNVRARDWEDMAAGPDHTLWLGDIGDNAERRDSISVVRVREPLTLRSRAVRGTRFRFRYANGPHNAEALLVMPRTGRLYVVTKASPHGGIFRAPKRLSTRRTNVLHRVARAPRLVTGGDVAPGGDRIVLRTHNNAYFYRRIGGRATKVLLPYERQGEAIGFTRRGNAVDITGEGLEQPIWQVAR